MDQYDDDEGFQQPTYEMAPREGEKFLPHQVRKVVKKVMDAMLKDAKYDDAKSKQMSLDLCQAVKERVKELGYARYKIIVQSIVGQVNNQGAYVTSRCLWDSTKDNYASISFKNDSLFCVCMVFGIFLE